MKIKIVLILLLMGVLLSGCGGGGGNTSSFEEADNTPVIEEITEIVEDDNVSTVENIYSVEQNETDIVAYIKENTREAFKVNGKDKSNIYYTLSGNDFSFCYIDPISGEIFFRNPTDYEIKSLYSFNVVLQDSLGHRTIKKVTIHIKNTKDEEPIEVIESNNSLVNDENKYFITTWEVLEDYENKITIPTLGDGYNYNVDWGDGTSSKNVTTSIVHTYNSSGVYTVKISGSFPRIKVHDMDVVEEDGKLIIKYNSNPDNLNSILKSIEQWGDIEWKSMRFAFASTKSKINAIDKPNLSNVTDLTGMFMELCQSPTIYDATPCGYVDLNHWDVSKVLYMSHMFDSADFEPDISEWNVSNVRDMSYMFTAGGSFRYVRGAVDPNISKWDVSNVLDMSYMFAYNTGFDGDIGNWDVSKVINMSSMFDGGSPYRPTSFNQDIGNWDVSNVTDMSRMFAINDKFNQDIGRWDVSNVINMSNMFSGEAWTQSVFNQDLENWNVMNDSNTSLMFENAPSLETLPSWYKE